MKVELHPCYILHQRPYRETSLLLDVFSRDYGRVSLIAKGAKREKSKFSGSLNLFWRFLAAWQGKNDLMTLTAVEENDRNTSLVDSASFAGFYLNELLIRLLHQHEAHPDLFLAYDEAVSALANSDNEQHTLRLFEKRLLRALGYALVLDHDIHTGNKIEPGTDYYYQPDRGPSLNKPSVPATDYIKISGKTLRDFEQDSLTEALSFNEAKQLMRYVLHKHLDGRPLASRDLYQSYIETRSQNKRY